MKKTVIIFIFIIGIFVGLGWFISTQKKGIELKDLKSKTTIPEAFEQNIIDKINSASVPISSDKELLEQTLKFEKALEEQQNIALKCFRAHSIFNEVWDGPINYGELKEKILASCTSKDDLWDIERFYLIHYPEFYDRIINIDSDYKMVSHIRETINVILEKPGIFEEMKSTAFVLLERMWDLKPSGNLDIKLKLSISHDLLSKCYPKQDFNFDFMVQKIGKLMDVKEKIFSKKEWTEKNRARLELAIREELLKQQEIFYREINPLFDECRK